MTTCLIIIPKGIFSNADFFIHEDILSWPLSLRHLFYLLERDNSEIEMSIIIETFLVETLTFPEQRLAFTPECFRWRDGA